MPTNFADWLHQRFAKGGAGRFRLADFDQDLRKTFQSPGAGPPFRRPAAAPHSETPGPQPAQGLPLRLSISYPLNGDRYMLPPRAEVVRLTGKAVCREPLPAVTWFVDGREVAATGPPYELPLDLPRGRHRLTVVGPGSQGDAIEVVVQ